MSISDQIRNYIVDSFLADSDLATVRDDDDLLGILDSLQILRMVMELEATYSVKVDNSELTPENLGSIAKLAMFIDRKREKSSCSTAVS